MARSFNSGRAVLALLAMLLCAAGSMAQADNSTIASGAGSRKLLQLVAQPGGACGGNINTRCPSGQCCSQYGWCGTTTAHCGTNCQSSWGTCSGTSSASGSNIAPSGGACGANINTRCPSGQCCSQYGWCGTTSAHCGTNCHSSWGTCSGFNPVPVVPSGSGSGATYSGDMTYFGCPDNAPNCLGACGKPLGTNADFAAISTALSDRLYGANTYPASFCGRNIVITAPNGRTATVPALDKCPSNLQPPLGCPIEGSVDVSAAVFQRLGYDLGVGRVRGITWRLQ